jgi:uncharacterized membrane protein YjjP (DUF1212 family)
MGDEQGRPPEERSAEGRKGEILVVGQAVKSTTRFSAEVVATMISLASAAFGVVAALAWNTAITTAFAAAFSARATKIWALFAYAVVATLVGVIVIVLLGRLAARIKAEPLEFKYPGVPRN